LSFGDAPRQNQSRLCCQGS
jgi:hypothetical protein